MKVDFFIGKQNSEAEKRAKALGFDKVYFVKEIFRPKEINERVSKGYDVALLIATELSSLRQMIDKAKNYFNMVFVLGTNDSVNRAVLEHKKVAALVSPEYKRSRDYIHYRNSGLNNVLCKIAKENSKGVFINVSGFLENDDKGRAKVLGRILQNIMLCRKYKTRMRVANFASKKQEIKSYMELRSFSIAIGMTPLEAKSALSS